VTGEAAAAFRIRAGLGLWLASWVPFAVILRLNGWAFVAVIVAEIILGLVGLVLAGPVVADQVKHVGWRRALPVIGRLLRRPKGEQQPPRSGNQL